MMWFLSVVMLALAVAGASMVAPGAALGEVLYRLSPNTLTMTQATIERYLGVWVWDDIAMAALTRPAWMIPLVFACIFAALAVRPYLERLGNLLRP